MEPALLTSVKLLIIVQLIYRLIRLFLQLGASNYTHPYVLFGLFAQLPVRVGGGRAPRQALSPRSVTA
jgi:hypothetical protein